MPPGRRSSRNTYLTWLALAPFLTTSGTCCLSTLLHQEAGPSGSDVVCFCHACHVVKHEYTDICFAPDSAFNPSSYCMLFMMLSTNGIRCLVAAALYLPAAWGQFVPLVSRHRNRRMLIINFCQGDRRC